MSEKRTCGNCRWLGRWINYPERNHGFCIKADRDFLKLPMCVTIRADNVRFDADATACPCWKKKEDRDG